MTSPIRILIGALGGQGGGVLAQWLFETATQCRYAAQATSIPGVAQRTGATTYYVEVYPVPIAQLGGRRPVLGLYAIPGAVDLVIASELVEALRIVQNGVVSVDRTTLVASTSRALTTTEKMALTDGRLDTDRLLAIARASSRRFFSLDMDKTAAQAGTMVSAVMLGAIAATGVLPFSRDAFEAAVRASGGGADASLRGFTLGFAALSAPATTTQPTIGAAAAALSFDEFPHEVRDIVALGVERQIAFQDRRYADLYRDRVSTVLAAETAVDPEHMHGFALTREAARFLALWMAFDDVVRVADLKSRASRFERVSNEVAAGPRDVVRIYDFFKPGVPEVAGTLAPSVAERLIRWDARRQRRGKAPLAWPLRVRTDTVHGLILLRALAALRRFRRRSSRYRREQADIERWLDAIATATRTDWQHGFELALCGRLIKGYGATNDRGRRNLLHIVEHLRMTDARAIREAREAALGDEEGKKLDETLARHGAPPRPVSARPIVWARRRSAATQTAH